MAADDTGQTDLDIDLVTASLRADTSDLRAFVEALATKLEDAMPGAVTVERRREGMFGPKRVRRISVDAANQRLEQLVAADGGMPKQGLPEVLQPRSISFLPVKGSVTHNDFISHAWVANPMRDVMPAA